MLLSRQAVVLGSGSPRPASLAGVQNTLNNTRQAAVHATYRIHQDGAGGIAERGVDRGHYGGPRVERAQRVLLSQQHAALHDGCRELRPGPLARSWISCRMSCWSVCTDAKTCIQPSSGHHYFRLTEFKYWLYFQMIGFSLCRSLADSHQIQPGNENLYRGALALEPLKHHWVSVYRCIGHPALYAAKGAGMAGGMSGQGVEGHLTS